MRRPVSVLVCLAVAAALAGCTPAAAPSAPTRTVTSVAGSPTPTPSGMATSAPTGSAPPPATSRAPSPVPSQQGGGKGCSPNGASIPAAADTAGIGGVDETDADATEFFSETPRFEFGVRTASGAVVALPDDLAGPAAHSGWIARFPLAVVAVIDDGRGATLHAFVDCRFVQTKGVDGRPYSFTLNGFGTVGTGVGCSSYSDGTRKLVGLNAVRQADGRYRIDSTEVEVSADGLTATNGATTKGTASFSRDCDQVRQANRSTCGDVPIVRTSGR